MKKNNADKLQVYDYTWLAEFPEVWVLQIPEGVPLAALPTQLGEYDGGSSGQGGW